MSKDHNDDECGCGCGSEGSAWFPLNSKVQVTNEYSLSITPPTGWVYVGYEKKTGKLKAATGGTTVSCDCTGTGNCLPFVATGSAGTTAGCAGSCTACTQKQSAKSVKFESGGYVNLAGGVNIAERADLPAAFAAMFEVPEIKHGFNAFLQKMYMDLPWPKMVIGEDFMSVPNGYSIIPVDVYGRVTMVPVPTASLRTATASGTKTSCSCTSGTCTLKTQSIPFVGSASWCEGSCSGTCTLSNAISVGNGATEDRYVARSYKF